MLKFLKRKAKTTGEKFANIAAGFVAITLWTIPVLVFYKWLFQAEALSFFGVGKIYNQVFYQYKHPFMIEFIAACLLAPAVEEVIFRKLPLDLARAAKKDEIMIPVVLGTSAIFGLMHFGIYSIPIQGVAGLVMASVYIKNGYSWWSSCLLHMAWNTALQFGILNLPS